MTRGKIKVATFSGGHGHAALLRGLKPFPEISITAIVAMTDSGKSTGILRHELGMLPPGDIRRCLGALATKNQELADLLEVRFKKGFLKGHAFGNLLIAALDAHSGGFDQAIHVLHALLGVKGQVLPATLSSGDLVALLEDGRRIVTEEAIDVPTEKHRPKIVELTIEPKVKANPEAVRAVRHADYLIFGPGDFYTSMLPSVLPVGLPHAIQSATGKSILVCNRTQKPGETSGLSALDMVKELERYTGKKIDTILMNIKNPKRRPLPPTVTNMPALIRHGVRVMAKDLADEEDPVRLDGQKVAAALRLLWRNKSI